MSALPAVSDVQRDFLREMMNIGSGSAALALARMLGAPVAIEIPRLRTWPAAASTLLKHLGTPPVTCAAMEMVGDVPGTLWFLVSQRDRAGLAVLSSGGSAVSDTRIKELADITVGVFLTAIHRFCGLGVHHTPPVLEVSRDREVLRKALCASQDGDTPGLLVEALFRVPRRPVRVHLLVVPRPEGVAALTGSLEHARALCIG